jgi:hypothetical protein
VSEQAYTGAWSDTDYDSVSTTGLDFTISEQRLFRLKVKDVDQQTQMLRLIDEGSKNAAYAVSNRKDQYIASMHSQIDAGNCYGTDASPITVGFGVGEVRPTDALARLDEILGTALAPKSNPRVVLPIWFGTYLNQELGTRQTAVGDGALKLGVQQGLHSTDVAGFSQVWCSGNCPNTAGAKYKVLAGDPYITFADAIAKVESMRMQNDFADLVKGLYVYGGKIPFGSHMALGTFNQGTRKEDA